MGSLEERVSNVRLWLHAMGSTASSGNGSAKTGEFHVGHHGLVTLPSLRSRSLDSNRNRRRKTHPRAKQHTSCDGLSEGESRSPATSRAVNSLARGKIHLKAKEGEEDSNNPLLTLICGMDHKHRNRSSSPSSASSTVFEDEPQSDNSHGKSPILGPLMPDSLYLHDQQKTRPTGPSTTHDRLANLVSVLSAFNCCNRRLIAYLLQTASAMLGCFLVRAAAVLW